MRAARDRAQQVLLRPRPEAAENLDILKRLDRIFTSDLVFGVRSKHNSRNA